MISFLKRLLLWNRKVTPPAPPPSGSDSLLMESGSYLLLETGDHILIE